MSDMQFNLWNIKHIIAVLYKWPKKQEDNRSDLRTPTLGSWASQQAPVNGRRTRQHSTTELSSTFEFPIEIRWTECGSDDLENSWNEMGDQRFAEI